jgi:signal peptidase I
MNLSDAASAGPAHALKCELASEVLRSSGKLRLQVTGWSMLPTIWPNDTVMVERVEPCAVSAGDIILVGRDRRLVAHRVVAKAGDRKETEIITQGDGMAHPDPPVAGADVLGRVSFIVRDGRCIEPDKKIGLPKRAVAELVRRSNSAARVVVQVHGMRPGRREAAKQS